MARRGLKALERRTVIVHHGQRSTRGVLVHAYHDCLVLRHAASLDDQVALAGDAVIPLGPSVWVQSNLPEEGSA